MGEPWVLQPNQLALCPNLRSWLQPRLLTFSALIKGFIVHDYEDQFDEGIRQLAFWLKENKLKYAENVIDGLENAPKAFLGLFAGENIGKQLVRVS